MNQSIISTCCSGLEALMSPRMFKALSDPNRVSILIKLTECCAPNTVSEVAECYSLDLSVVSRHLAMLRDAGIIKAEKRGKEVFYTVCYDSLAGTLRQIADAIESCCPADSESRESKL